MYKLGKASNSVFLSLRNHFCSLSENNQHHIIIDYLLFLQISKLIPYRRVGIFHSLKNCKVVYSKYPLNNAQHVVGSRA